MTENFWIALTAVAALASTVGAGVSLLVGVWLRRRTRPEADWAFTATASIVEADRYSGENAGEGHVRINGVLANAGDAPASRLTMSKNVGGGYLSSPGAATALRPVVHEWLAVVMPGDRVNFQFQFPPEQWENAVFTLDWITSPTRLKKHLQWELKPSDSMEDPRLEPQPDASH